MATTVNGCDPSKNVKACGATGYIDVYAVGNARAHRICPGDPIATELDGNILRGVAASAFPWTTDAPTTRTAFKAAFIGASNDAVFNDACSHENPTEIQYFKKNDLNNVLTFDIASPGVVITKGAFLGLAEDPITPGQLSDTLVEIVPEAEATFIAKFNSGGVAVTTVDVEYAHA